MAKKYTIEIIVHEGSDEFWEEVTADGKSGTDEVVNTVKEALYDRGFDDDNMQIRLMKFEDK